MIAKAPWGKCGKQCHSCRPGIIAWQFALSDFRKPEHSSFSVVFSLFFGKCGSPHLSKYKLNISLNCFAIRKMPRRNNPNVILLLKMFFKSFYSFTNFNFIFIPNCSKDYPQVFFIDQSFLNALVLKVQILDFLKVPIINHRQCFSQLLFSRFDI
mgnify:CR=1 FL=1